MRPLTDNAGLMRTLLPMKIKKPGLHWPTVGWTPVGGSGNGTVTLSVLLWCGCHRCPNGFSSVLIFMEVRGRLGSERLIALLMEFPPHSSFSYHGNSGEVGCYVASRPLTKDSNYFEVIKVVGWRTRI